jgi:hypothetical protein
MTTSASFFTRGLLGVISFCLLAAEAGPLASERPVRQEGSKPAHMVRVSIKADRDGYSLRDAIELSVALRNEGDSPVYVDTRMFWGYSL